MVARVPSIKKAFKEKCKSHYPVPHKSGFIIWNLADFSYSAINKGKGRIIKPGQLIHASVAFKLQGEYTPKAIFSADMKGKSWGAIIGRGRDDDIAWANDLEDILEIDLFDPDQAVSMIKQLTAEVEGKNDDSAYNWLARLSILALHGMLPLFYLCATRLL